jgi:predicted  nucleic acid-binding Zn-ribbon protein
MTIELEKKLLTKDLEKTPAVILEQLFSYIETHRIKTEGSTFTSLNRRISRLKEGLNGFEEELITAEKEEAKEIQEAIKNWQEKLKEVTRERRVMNINFDILWRNQLRIEY